MIPLITIPSSPPGFHRVWKPPKKALRGGSLGALTIQGEYLSERSKQRMLKRSDVDVIPINPMEFGHYEGFRMITTI